jgi:hypothetical protein
MKYIMRAFPDIQHFRLPAVVHLSILVLLVMINAANTRDYINRRIVYRHKIIASQLSFTEIKLSMNSICSIHCTTLFIWLKKNDLRDCYYKLIPIFIGYQQ